MAGAPETPLSPVQMARVLALSTQVERRARGIADTVIETQRTVPPRPLIDLSALSDDQLDQFESLLRLATQPTPHH